VAGSQKERFGANVFLSVGPKWGCFLSWDTAFSGHYLAIYEADVTNCVFDFKIKRYLVVVFGGVP
jgi:hypothetical protein